MRSYYLYIAVALVILAGAIGGRWWLQTQQPAPTVPVATTTPPVAKPAPTSTVSVIGHSVKGREIKAYTFGTGSNHVLFVGGMHGGYEWNAVVLAYDVIDYFKQHPEAIPANETVAIIPDINPDAVYEVTHKTGPITVSDVLPIKDKVFARFNANGVDLNRNFDCHWQPKSSFLGKTTSAGTAPFSEPEAAALRDYVSSFKPLAVAFWHSKAGTVYGASCNGPVSASDLALMNTYADAAHYRTESLFTAYTIHGDAESWLTSIGIPAVTVELTTHDTVEYQKNLAGVTAVLAQYARTHLAETATTTSTTTK